MLIVFCVFYSCCCEIAVLRCGQHQLPDRSSSSAVLSSPAARSSAVPTASLSKPISANRCTFSSSLC